MKKALLPLLVLAAPLSFAQTPYDGLDINFNEGEPPLYSYCKNVVGADPKYTGDTRYAAKEACDFGVDEARRMADRFGGGNGMIQGYFRGYAFGLHEMYEASENDGVQMQLGQAQIGAMGGYFEAGFTEGINKGNSEGKSDGKSEAIVRFDKAVREAVPGTSGVLPSNQVVPPNRTYTPEPNAYYRLVPADKRVYTSIDDIIKAKDERELGELTLQEFPVYSQYDATTWGETTRLTLWDLWFGDGRYVFAKALWYDEKAAIQTWLSRPVASKPEYQKLALTNLPDVNGVRVDMQAVFRAGFVEAYKYYVNYHFARKFKEGVAMGHPAGKAIGTQLGKRVAFGRGLVPAFNKKFEESAVITYQNTYKGAFMSSFNDTFADYAGKPKIDFVPLAGGSPLNLKGVDDDGIIQPGEAFSLKFKLKNMGGVGNDLKGVLSGDILNAQPVAGKIEKLMVKEYDTVQPIAQVDSRLQSGDEARISLTINSATTAINQKVFKMIKMTASPSFEADALQGIATVSAFVQNVSTVESPAHVSGQAIIDGRVAGEVNIGKLVAGQSARLDIKLRNLDPLDIINKQIDVKISVLLGGTVLESMDVALKSKASDKDLVNYLGQLANGKGTVPSTTTASDRLDDVKKITVSRNRAEMQRYKNEKYNAWKKSPDSTLPGMIRTNKQLGATSEEAKQVYHKLAVEMWKDKKILPQFLFFGAKRKAFKNILEDISNSGKLKD